MVLNAEQDLVAVLHQVERILLLGFEVEGFVVEHVAVTRVDGLAVRVQVPDTLGGLYLVVHYAIGADAETGADRGTK